MVNIFIMAGLFLLGVGVVQEATKNDKNVVKKKNDKNVEKTLTKDKNVDTVNENDKIVVKEVSNEKGNNNDSNIIDRVSNLDSVATAENSTIQSDTPGKADTLDEPTEPVND